MDSSKALDKVVEAIKNSNNVLVTINRNPDVDQIAAAIALSFVLEKLEKFTTTIFSGLIPAAAEFLDPEKTFSSNMETLRDFVISINKDKVDRLRYKQEGDNVRVYLTPYRTTISQNDLEFENGNYNIDLVITIGTVTQEDMDNAIIGAIRILHDATVVAINTGGTVPSYATVSWADPEEIAYCEMVADLAEILGENEIDEHTATSLLTGIVAATDQFKNIKANPKVMQLAAKLMSFGANQQLISIKLEEGYKLDQQNPVQPQNAPNEQQVDQGQVIENINQNVDATTNAVNVINNDMARNNAENAIEQISNDGYIHHDKQPVPAQPPQQQPQQQPDLEESQQQSPQMPQPSGAPWPPKMEDMQHGRDYSDYYNNSPNSTQPTPQADETQPLAPVEQPTPVPVQNAPMPPVPALDMNMGGMPMPPMPPMPEPAGNVMSDLANYAPPTIPEPSLPQSEPTPGFFAPPSMNSEVAPPFPPPVQQDITSRTFMSGDSNLDNPGAAAPIPGDQQLSEDTANATSADMELADLGNIAAQATAEELSSDSGRASFDVSQELGSGQGPNPFLASNNTPGPEVNDPAAQLQQAGAMPPVPPAGDVPSNQFKIPGQ